MGLDSVDFIWVKVAAKMMISDWVVDREGTVESNLVCLRNDK